MKAVLNEMLERTVYTKARKGSRDEGGALKPRFILLKSFSQGWMCPEKAFLSSLSWADF